MNDEKWTCAGIRAARGKRFLAWVDLGGTEMLQPARSARCVLGATYILTVSRDGGEVRLHGDPVFVETGTITAQVLAWRAVELAAEAELSLGRVERRAKVTDPLDQVMIPLVAAASLLRTPAERRAFAAEVLRRLQRDAW